MLRNLLVKSDGTEIDSSAIFSMTCTETVNDGTELTFGSVCSDEIEVEYIVDLESKNLIAQGDAVTYYRVNENGEKVRTVGVFYCEKPEYQSVMRGANGEKNLVYKVTAYDSVGKLDADFTQWLVDNQDLFPMTIDEIAGYACKVAGVELENNLPINGDYSVSAFSVSDLTCRQIINWAADAGACYAHANTAGKIEFKRYTDKRGVQSISWQEEEKTALVDSAGQYVHDSTGAQIYLRNEMGDSAVYWLNGLTYEDYNVAKIEKVQIRQSDDDIGVVYPDDTNALNTYVIQSNYLLLTGTEEALKPVAQNIYDAIKDITYKPCSVSIADEGYSIYAGDIIRVRNAFDEVFDTYVMATTTSGGNVDIDSTGSASRDSTSAVNSQTFKNLTGKMLEIKTSVDGLNVKASQLEGDYTEIKATVDGLSTEVVKDGEVRSKFAMDTESVTIESGVITFAGNTLVVDSDNFKLEQDGTVTITGTFTSETDTDRAYIGEGQIELSKVVEGSYYPTIKMYSTGTSAAALGHIEVCGEQGEERVKMYTNEATGYIEAYATGGTMIFQACADGRGEGHVSIGGVNGLGYLECKYLKVDGHNVACTQVYYKNGNGDTTWEYLLTAHQGNAW